VQRVPIVGLAFIGLFISRYLAAFQLGHIESVWDPFFSGSGGGRNGSEAVVTSSVSKAFPIADAGFGAVAYILDVLTGAIGDQRRWRTMPWLVLLFGFLIVPLGAVSVYFIIIQPTIIGALCALCLAQAAVTVLLRMPTISARVRAAMIHLCHRSLAHGIAQWVPLSPLPSNDPPWRRTSARMAHLRSAFESRGVTP
jgi:uncharacterized membrane protein